MCPPVYAVFYSALALLVIARHHANIVRLIKGEESKISFKKK
jgi:glycerol-3-phosphate acyltransferase PlsY